MTRFKFLLRFFDHWPAKVLSLGAALFLSFLYHADTMGERFFSVPLELRLQEGFAPASSYQENVRIILRGQREQIFSILEDDIKAWVDFSEYGRPGLYKAPVEIRRQGTALDIDTLEIKVEPLEVTLLQEMRMTRSLEVVPDLKGSPARGYQLIQSFLTPSSVTVEGPRSHVENLRQISTEEIDLTGRREDFTIRVRLVHEDSFIQLPGGNVVECRGVIDEAIRSETFRDVGLVTLGLSEDLNLADDLPLLTVQLQAYQQRLEALRPEDLLFTLDCSDISGPGVYEISVNPHSIEDVVLLGFSPEVVTLTVEEAP